MKPISPAPAPVVTEPAGSPPDPEGYPAAGYAWYVVGVLTLAYIFSFIDRQILSLMVGPIQKDLGIGDMQMSLLMGFTFRRVLHALRDSAGPACRHAQPPGDHLGGHRRLECDDRRLRAGQDVLATGGHAHGRRSGRGESIAVGLFADLGLFPAATAVDRHERLLDGHLHRCRTGVHPGRVRHAACFRQGEHRLAV